MSVLSKAGSFAQPSSTGNQAVTGVGFTPTVVMFSWNTRTSDGSSANACYGSGAATNSSNRWSIYFRMDNSAATRTMGNSNALCIQINNTTSAFSKADFVSMDADGFTVNWSTADATARIINYLALGGDVANASVGRFATPGSAGNNSITGLGFKPDSVLFFGQSQTSTTISGANGLDGSFGIATSSVSRYTSSVCWTVFPLAPATVRSATNQLSNLVIYNVVVSGVNNYWSDFVSMDADGFTLKWLKAFSGRLMYYVAIKGGRSSVGSFNQPTGIGSQTITTNGVSPKAILAYSTNRTSSTATSVAFGEFTRGISDGTNQCSLWSGLQDNSSTTSNCSMNLDRSNFVKMMTENGASPTTQAAASLTSMGVNNFNLNWSSADSTQREVIYLTIGDPSPEYIQGASSIQGVSNILF